MYTHRILVSNFTLFYRTSRFKDFSFLVTPRPRVSRCGRNNLLADQVPRVTTGKLNFIVFPKPMVVSVAYVGGTVLNSLVASSSGIVKDIIFDDVVCGSYSSNNVISTASDGITTNTRTATIAGNTIIA